MKSQGLQKKDHCFTKKSSGAGRNLKKVLIHLKQNPSLLQNTRKKRTPKDICLISFLSIYKSRYDQIEMVARKFAKEGHIYNYCLSSPH